MKFSKFFCLSILFLSFDTIAHTFALIQDKDGFSNVRNKPSLSAKVINTVKNQELVRCVSTDESPKFCYINSNKGKSGYIYKDRLDFFKDYKKLNLVDYNINNAKFKGNDIEVIISANSNSGGNNFKEIKTKSGSRVILNGSEVYGTDDSLPDQRFSQLRSIIVKSKQGKVIIDKREVEGFFFPSIGLNNQNELGDFQIFSLENKIYILNTFNNGGAGEYNVGFYINNGKLVEKYFWKTDF